MQSKQTAWPTLLCIACLVAAAATICLPKRTRPLVTASMTHSAVDSETKTPARPLSILKGANHQIAVYGNEDGFRCTVKDLNGKPLAPNLTLTELAYEYPELHKMVKSKLSEKLSE